MRTRRGQPRDTGGRPGRDGAQMMEPEKKRDRGRSRQTDRQTRTHTHRQERTYRAKAAENHVPPTRVWEPQAPGVFPGARPARLPRVRTGGSAPWERADRTVSGPARPTAGRTCVLTRAPETHVHIQHEESRAVASGLREAGGDRAERVRARSADGARKGPGGSHADCSVCRPPALAPLSLCLRLVVPPPGVLLCPTPGGPVLRFL